MTKLSRRSFLGSSTFLSFAGALGLLPTLYKSNQKQKKVFVHHVFFWLKNPDAAADKAKLVEGLQSLKAIKAIRMARIGVPAGTSRDVIESSYDLSWLLFFDSPRDQDIYQDHPVHLKFVEKYAHLWAKVVVYDSVDI